ncbi:hypothetical protein [Gordonia malaquae]|uniref:hypothetical protein n=1 Tax=Gordonia malaquae TaxID=410332 RepID=UPI0030FEC150
MNSDSQPSIKGDVIVGGIRRISGEVGGDGLIEIPLVGHNHRYQVRVDRTGAIPQLIELRLVSEDDTAEIDPATIRQVPVRRLAHAAAMFIAYADGAFTTIREVEDPALNTRPENRGRQVLDDAHYRNVADLLMRAQQLGHSSPRQAVRDQMYGRPSLPTVDRWIREAKVRGYLARDWSTAPTTPTTSKDNR